MPMATNIMLLVFLTCAIVVTAEYVVDNLSRVTDENPSFSTEELALVFLLIACKAVELYFALKVTSTSDLRRCFKIAVGSNFQIALFIIPLMSVITWIAGKPSFMLFDLLESIMLCSALLTASPLVRLGLVQSHWHLGMTLVCFYFAVTVASWINRESDIQMVAEDTR